MIEIEETELFEIFPAIETISNAFEYQNSMLNKIVLTGKINALEIAENLFNFTEQTAQTFTELQTKLIEHLLEESKKELLSKAKIQAKTFINMLNMNIYKRKVDVEVLRADINLIKFFKNEISKTEMKKRLEEYIEKYTLFDEIMLLDSTGNVKLNINENNKVRYSKDEILKQLKDDEVLYDYRRTDLFIKNKRPMFFATKIDNLGFLVVFFKFKEQVEILLNELITKDETLVLTDKFNNILASSEKGIDKNFIKGINKLDDFVIKNSKFFVKTNVDEYNGFKFKDVYAISIQRRGKDINIMSEFNNSVEQNRKLIQIDISRKELKKLANDGYAILEDLSDVIINGELIAAKSKQYILIPILDNLREVSFRVVKLIELSISSLQKIIEEALSNFITALSKITIDALNRNLYNLCNDIRWWAMDETFKDLNNKNKIADKIKFLHSLYPNYKDILVFDRDGKIISSINNKSDVIENSSILSNRDTNKCVKSEFKETIFYDNKPTYIAYASIIDGNDVIGGIAVVFDVIKQFQEFLNLNVTEEDIIVLIVDKHRKIISSNNEKYKILDTFEEINESQLVDNYLSDIKIDNKTYKLTVSEAKDYEGYDSNLYSIVMKGK